MATKTVELKAGYAVMRGGKLIDDGGNPMAWKDFISDYDAWWRMTKASARKVAREEGGRVVTISILIEAAPAVRK